MTAFSLISQITPAIRKSDRLSEDHLLWKILEKLIWGCQWSPPQKKAPHTHLRWGRGGGHIYKKKGNGIERSTLWKRGFLTKLLDWNDQKKSSPYGNQWQIMYFQRLFQHYPVRIFASLVWTLLKHTQHFLWIVYLVSDLEENEGKFAMIVFYFQFLSDNWVFSKVWIVESRIWALKVNFLGQCSTMNTKRTTVRN